MTSCEIIQSWHYTNVCSVEVVWRQWSLEYVCLYCEQSWITCNIKDELHSRALVTGGYSHVKKFGNAQKFYAQVSKTDRQTDFYNFFVGNCLRWLDAKKWSLWHFVLNILSERRYYSHKDALFPQNTQGRSVEAHKKGLFHVICSEVLTMSS